MGANAGADLGKVVVRTAGRGSLEEPPLGGEENPFRNPARNGATGNTPGVRAKETPTRLLLSDFRREAAVNFMEISHSLLGGSLGQRDAGDLEPRVFRPAGVGCAFSIHGRVVIVWWLWHDRIDPCKARETRSSSGFKLRRPARRGSPEVGHS